jgi:hypothetical protein
MPKLIFHMQICIFPKNLKKPLSGVKLVSQIGAGWWKKRRKRRKIILEVQIFIFLRPGLPLFKTQLVSGAKLAP